MKLVVLGAAPVCARCASRGPTCCEPEEGVALAPLTPGDVRRIASKTGLFASQFVTTRKLDRVERAALVEDDPVLAGLVGRDGLLHSLAKAGRACVFHRQGAGCSLDPATRPLLCRRFPFLRRPRTITARPGGDCLACEEADDIDALFALMGTSPEHLRDLDRRIRRDLRPNVIPTKRTYAGAAPRRRAPRKASRKPTRSRTD